MSVIEGIKLMNHAIYHLSQAAGTLNQTHTNRDGLLTWEGMILLSAIKDAQGIIRTARTAYKHDWMVRNA